MSLFSLSEEKKYTYIGDCIFIRNFVEASKIMFLFMQKQKKRIIIMLF